jgi:uncharacterized membrane protein
MKTCSALLPPFGRASALSVLFFALGAGSLGAATIQGTVLNQNTRNFLERAVVQVPDTSFQALTDRDGTFRISGLPAGTYTVRADYAGLEQVSKSVTVTADQTVRVDFELTSAEI